MKKRIEKKLSLSRETLRNLSERELAGVLGGESRWCGSGGTSSSCTDTCATCECTTTTTNC